jgi:hypothetical protein
MKKSALLILPLLLLFACDKNKLGEELTIPYGETIEIPDENLKITFTAVDDSRCPKEVQCPTEGAASATLTVDQGGNSATVEVICQGLCFDETGPCGSEAAAMGYLFKLLYIYPYPEEGVQVNEEDYSLKVNVSIFQPN